jgi:hypothetical protein
MTDPSTNEERHYTVQELSREWVLSAWMIRKLFEDEPDVLTIGHRLASRRRKYITIRIPEHVKERVRRRLAVRAA